MVVTTLAEKAKMARAKEAGLYEATTEYPESKSYNGGRVKYDTLQRVCFEAEAAYNLEEGSIKPV